MAKESAFSRKVQKHLKARGAWVVKFHASAYTPKGIPDLLVCYQGAFIGLELKTGSKLSEWQIVQGNRIHKAGGYWLELTPAGFPTMLDTLLDELDGGRS